MRVTYFLSVIFLFNSIFWVHASDIGLINYPNAMEHAPAGVTGDHNHKKGEWMFSYRYMFMQMHDNRISGRKITDSEIATSQPNRFASVIGQPSNLRVIPKSMTMEMHMFGGMYAPSDFVTVMIMTNYSKKQMDHTTFRGGSGNNKLGEFETCTSGIGDLQISSLLQIYNRNNFNLIMKSGLSLPIGSTNQKDKILTPQGNRPKVLLPYSMQNGSGTMDITQGIIGTKSYSHFSYGASWESTFRTQRSSGYNLGHKHKLTSWLAIQPINQVSISARVEYLKSDRINGINSNIILPVQTADPTNSGGDILNINIGLNTLNLSYLKGCRFGFEIRAPLYQRMNGLQMENDVSLISLVQIAF